MVRKIVFSAILLCLFIAIPLSIVGIEQVELGEPFLAFVKTCDHELSDFKVAIPDIPTIPRVNNLGGFEFILNAFITFANIFVNLINIISKLLNVIIQVVQFIVIVVKNLILFKDNLVNYQVPVV